jgi:uncharacterized protein
VHGTNGAEELASGSFETFTEVHTVSFPVGIFVQFSNMIFQGVPERFPKLRLAFLEIGCTWLPYWLDRMDEHWEKRGKIETPQLKQRPSACVRERPIYFSLEAEETLLPETFRYVGDEHFVYATDIPHWDTEFQKICIGYRAERIFPTKPKTSYCTKTRRRFTRSSFRKV